MSTVSRQHRPKAVAGWYSTQGGNVAHYFTPWTANEYFLVPACNDGMIGARLPDHLRKVPARRCKRCAKRVPA